MGRIPEEELERIKRETDLVALVRARGVELAQHGADLLGLCPFHDDHEPSLVVSPKKNLWHCLGACDSGGSVVDWVMRSEGVSFRHAVEILRSGGPPPSLGGPVVRASSVRRLPPPVELSAADHELLLQVVDYYHATLQSAPEALAYLKTRGIDSADAVRVFRLGFANRTLGLRLPSKSRADGLRMRHRLASLGILRASTGHEHFNGSLVIPVFDEQGRVVEMYGRKITPRLRAGTPNHTYLPGPHRGVWNLAALRSSKEVILCEALIDALTFWCAGFFNVTSSYGVHGFTADHLEAMKAFGTERVLIAYDRDAAGDAAAKDLAAKLAAEGITSFRVRFPHGMDANDYACKVTPASQSLAVLLRAAEYVAGPLVRPSAPVAPVALGIGVAAEAGQASADVEPKPSSLAAASAAEPTPAAEASAAAEAASPAPGEPPPASPVPSAPRASLAADVSEQQVVIHQGDRTWRIRGLARNLSFESMKVNVFVGSDGHPDRYHVDTLDLYLAKPRAVFIRAAAAELGCGEDVVKRDLGAVLLKLEELQEAAVRKTLEPKAAAVAISDADRAAALELLRDPRLLERILEDFERCGVVGERTNKLVAYLATVTRKLDEPLAVIIQSSTAAGKSALMKAVLAFVPEEERIHYSAMTGQSLFYMAETDLAHKILAIAEEEGAERASYALKLLQSEGELSIASTGKDPTTGRLVTHEYQVKGPVMIFLTTTAIDLDEELRNRCLVLSVDEDREQTRAIHRLQRERRTLEGLFARKHKSEVLALHRNAQRLLQPLPVANPYARQLTFLDSQTRTRRDHEKYLTLIEAMALLNQHQRERKTAWRDGREEAYIEVTLADIEVANRLAHEALGRTLDELPPQTRRFLVLLDGMVSAACGRLRLERRDYRFSRWDIRHALGWSYDQVRIHLERLVELEYVLVHRGGRGQSFVYELLWDGKGADGQPFVIGLIDVGTLRQAESAAATTPTLDGLEPGLGGEEPGFGGPFAAHWAPVGGGLEAGSNGRKASRQRSSLLLPLESLENPLLPGLELEPLGDRRTDAEHVSPVLLAEPELVGAGASHPGDNGRRRA